MTTTPLQAGSATTGGRSLRARAAGAAGGARDYLVGLSRLDLLLAMTLIEVLLHTAGRATAVVSVLAILGLLYRPAARHPLFWLAIAGIILVATILPSWETMFNHDWVIFYWTLTLGIALWWRDPEDILAGSARLIIGLVFLFAVIWKAITPEFPGGSFFELTMLTDERFEVVGQIAGAPDGAAAAHREGIAAWRDQGLGAPPAVALESGSAVPAIAQFMAIWTLLIEGSIALLFLLPRRGAVGRIAEIALVLFILTTYPLAPVVGFGWILIILSFAQTSFSPRVAHVFYPAAFVALQSMPLVDEVLGVLVRVAG